MKSTTAPPYHPLSQPPIQPGAPSAWGSAPPAGMAPRPQKSPVNVPGYGTQQVNPSALASQMRSQVQPAARPMAR